LLLLACVGCSDPSAKPDAGVPDDAYAPKISITPGGFEFGEHELGTEQLPPPLDVSIKNISPLPVDLTSISIGGADAADFAITTNGCGASLAPDEACPLTLLFDPHGANLRAAHLDVMTGADTVSAPISGTGIVHGLKLVFDPPSRNFGDLDAGATSGQITFDVLNEAVAATFTASVTGDDAASFQIVSTTCNAALALHATCQVVASMTAGWTGEYVANLTLSAGASGSWSAGLTGSSSTPIKTTPASATLGSMLIGQPEATPAATFTVKNTSAATTGTLTPTLIGAGASSYSIDSTDCTTLTPDATCSVVVSLAATTRGNKLADLVITDGASGVQSRSALIGSAYTVFISPSTQFAATTVGQSTSKTIAVLNPSDRDTGAVSLSIVGTQFAIVSSTCASGITAHSFCTVDVSFDPTSTGTKTATLQASASPGDSHSVTLTGVGQ
jgi:hypothetical protein